MTPKTSQSTAITLINCAKTFPNGTRALEPMSLTVSGGETVVLLGPSGCGKTTLLRLIAGLEAPDTGGRVLFNDEEVTGNPIEKRNVGMVFQSYALFPNMTVYDNVAYGLSMRRMPKKELCARVDDMLEMMHIADLAKRRVDQLSGGQRQRVALARAIAVRPRVLLLDEPLTALDALLRDRLRVEIDNLLRSLGITAVYVTHDQAEAMALGDRIVVMSKGQIAQVGSPRDIYYHPASDFVADFIGTVNRVPTDMLSGALDTVGPELLFRPADIDIVEEKDAHITGRVATAFFLGDRTRLVLEIPNGQQIVVESPRRDPFVIGASISIRIRPDSLIKLSPTSEKP